LIGNSQLLFIDEAQRIPEAGINLKIIHDELPEVKVMVTGSSSLDLATKISEPLTGRKIVFNLFPVSCQELLQFKSSFEVRDKLEELLIYGSYPEILTTTSLKDKRSCLEEIGGSYLFRDIFDLLNLRNKEKLFDLLRLLAFQIGSEVSVNELSNTLKMNRETVEYYLTLLEETFIIFKLRSFNRNLRKEVSKMSKYFFYDLGMRNYLINNFNPINLRNDIGHLWENFLILERMKYLSYSEVQVNSCFWRTYTGAELDYVEERDGILTGYEFKWNRKQVNPPAAWVENYGGAFHIVSRENWLGFITPEN
jgi:predicted AAA+ superfamily ATPase